MDRINRIILFIFFISTLVLNPCISSAGSVKLGDVIKNIFNPAEESKDDSIEIDDNLSTSTQKGGSLSSRTVSGGTIDGSGMELFGSGIAGGSPDLKLVFGGDVMLARNVAKSVKRYGNGDYFYPFQRVADYLNSADFVFVNLEGIISNKGIKNLTKSAPWFRADPSAVYGLKRAGIDMVSLSNNHIFDYWRKGMEDCMRRLKDAGILYCGAGFTHEEAYSPVIVNVKGVKIAFLSFTNHGSPLWAARQEWSFLQELEESEALKKFLGFDLDPFIPDSVSDSPLFKTKPRSGDAWLYSVRVKLGIKKAREEGADLVVVHCHFGKDYSKLPSSPQDRYAHLAIDEGADLVVGTSPHVTQPIVKYNDGYIVYSLGNFIFDQRESYNPDGIHSMLLEVNVKNKKIVEVKPKNIKIVEPYWYSVFE